MFPLILFIRSRSPSDLSPRRHPHSSLSIAGPVLWPNHCVGVCVWHFWAHFFPAAILQTFIQSFYTCSNLWAILSASSLVSLPAHCLHHCQMNLKMLHFWSQSFPGPFQKHPGRSELTACRAEPAVVRFCLPLRTCASLLSSLCHRLCPLLAAPWGAPRASPSLQVFLAPLWSLVCQPFFLGLCWYSLADLFIWHLIH